ncbi:MAG: hypothetical protein WD009_09235 [Phycisphaeraceae bacterium]
MDLPSADRITVTSTIGGRLPPSGLPGADVGHVDLAQVGLNHPPRSIDPPVRHVLAPFRKQP